MRCAVAVVLLLVGCDGLGRPIVGSSEPPDAAVDRTCEVQPACTPVRTVDPAHFDLPLRMPDFNPPLDCDADEIDDRVDNCPGVPNPTQSLGACASAVSDCERMVEGNRSLTGADLRGCALSAPVALSEDLDLTGAQLGCSHLRFSAERAVRVRLNEAQVRNASITFDGPIAVEMNRTTAEGSDVSLESGASVELDDSILRNSGLWLDPRAAIPLEGQPGPSIDVRRSDLDNVTVHEPSSARAARMRVDDSNVSATTISVPRLDAHATTVTGSRLAAAELGLQDVAMNASQIRGDFVTIASSDLNDVVFDTCVDLRLSDSTAVVVDVPECEPGRFRSVRTELTDGRFGGGLEMEEGELIASVVVGGGPTSSFRSNGGIVNGVQFCAEIAIGAFVGGEIRCAGCGAEAFMGGNGVCVTDATIYRRGCQAIELAPQCE